MLTLEDQIERIADAALAASLEHTEPAIVPIRARFRPPLGVGVAATVMLIGLVGVLIGVVGNRERPAGTAENPPPSATPTATPIALGRIESLGASDWVVATVVPDGLEYLYPLAPEGAGRKTVWYGTRRDDGTSEQMRVTVGIDEPLETGESVDIDGVSWTVSESGGGRWSATRPVGNQVVSVGAPGSFDDTAGAVLAGLAVVSESALPSPPLGPRDSGIELAATEFHGVRYSLAVQESNGFACTWVISTGGASGGCGSWTDPSALLTITGGTIDRADGSDVIDVVVGGAVTKDATRVEVEFVDGTIVSASPTDLSGRHDQNFWIVGAEIGPDDVTGRVPSDEAVEEARAYGTDGQLLATATPP